MNPTCPVQSRLNQIHTENVTSRPALPHDPEQSPGKNNPEVVIVQYPYQLLPNMSTHATGKSILPCCRSLQTVSTLMDSVALTRVSVALSLALWFALVKCAGFCSLFLEL